MGLNIIVLKFVVLSITPKQNTLWSAQSLGLFPLSQASVSGTLKQEQKSDLSHTVKVVLFSHIFWAGFFFALGNVTPMCLAYFICTQHGTINIYLNLKMAQSWSFKCLPVLAHNSLSQSYTMRLQ